MRSGARTQSEFIDGEPRSKSERRKADRAHPTSTPRVFTPTWPLITVAQPAELENNTIVYEWDEFLNHLGAKNRNRGRARSLGSVGITHLKATELGRMVGEKFGNEYYRTENSAEKTLRKVRKELQDFMHSSSHYATLTTTQKVAQQREAERERIQAESEGAIYIASSLLTFEDREELYKNVYCGMPLKVGGLALFGSGGKLAMDLSQNEGLYEARSGIINFMRRQGYNTQHIDPAWTPHAVVFDYLDHIKSQPITRQLEVPDTFIARPPEVCADFDQ